MLAMVHLKGTNASRVSYQQRIAKNKPFIYLHKIKQSHCTNVEIAHENKVLMLTMAYLKRTKRLASLLSTMLFKGQTRRWIRKQKQGASSGLRFEDFLMSGNIFLVYKTRTDDQEKSGLGVANLTGVWFKIIMICPNNNVTIVVCEL